MNSNWFVVSPRKKNRKLLTWINRHQQHHIHSATEKSLVGREHNLFGYKLNWLKGQPRLDSSIIMFESSCSLVSPFAGSGRDRREFLEVGMQFGPPCQLLSALGNNVLSVLRKIPVNVPSEQASCKTTPHLHPHRSEIFVCPVVKKTFLQ